MAVWQLEEHDKKSADALWLMIAFIFAKWLINVKTMTKVWTVSFIWTIYPHVHIKRSSYLNNVNWVWCMTLLSSFASVHARLPDGRDSRGNSWSGKSTNAYNNCHRKIKALVSWRISPWERESKTAIVCKWNVQKERMQVTCSKRSVCKWHVQIGAYACDMFK